MSLGLKILLTIHAIVTLAAGIVLIVAPTLIPLTVDIRISSDQYLLSYFLGAAELSIAYLSFYSRTINDKYSLRVIISTFIVFHSATGILEIYALIQGTSFKIISNIILRVVMIALFYYFGNYRNKINNTKPTS